MKKFSKFTFESFSFDEKSLKANFYYSFDNWSEIFEEIIDFKSDKFEIPKTSSFLKGSTWNVMKGEWLDPILNNFLFNLHIALWISYYKLFPTKILEVKSGYLNDEQILFWEKFYRNGLGEFFIKNNIDFSDLINFKNVWKVPDLEKVNIINDYIENKISPFKGGLGGAKNLLLWWGWKDSITSLILLESPSIEKRGIKGELWNVDLFVFWKIDKIKENTAKIAEKEILLVKRQLSNNLFKLNQKWYYNWHVPITGIIAFVTFVVSYLYWYENIILSNEKSASENNTIWNWLNINHQYSKSQEFEDDLNNYLHTYISKNINYFSLLRDKYEYEIAEIFAKKAKKFFNSFSSCNRNFKINKSGQTHRSVPTGNNVGVNLCVHPETRLWCCECEKCCFVFLILSAHLQQEELINIFWENLFDKISLEKTFRELIWFENYKPFECVWTYNESLLAIKKAINNNYSWIILDKLKLELIEK